MTLFEPVNLDHLQAMLSTCNRKTVIGSRDYALMLALLDTGARASEMIAAMVTFVQPEVECTSCGQMAKRIHSRYLRTLADCPLPGRRLQLQL